MKENINKMKCQLEKTNINILKPKLNLKKQKSIAMKSIIRKSVSK
jgi:hypothetical protein